MELEGREDEALVELAQAGWPSAFAVLVYRYAPLLLAAHGGTRDPYRRTLESFRRAMRALPELSPGTAVDDWLLGLARRETPAEVPAADPSVVDGLWRELSARWPDGRRPRRRVGGFVKGVAVVVIAIAIGVAVPAVLLTAPPIEQEQLTELRAEPLGERQPVEELDDEPAQPLPTFEFPDVTSAPPPADPGVGVESVPAPVDPGPSPAPAPPPVPTTPVDPGPGPDPEPDPDPAPDPVPDPPDGDLGAGGGDGDGDGEAG